MVGEYKRLSNHLLFCPMPRPIWTYHTDCVLLPAVAKAYIQQPIKQKKQ